MRVRDNQKGVNFLKLMKGFTSTSAYLSLIFSSIVFLSLFAASPFTLAPLATAVADELPQDNGLATYHTAPRYRESESHPLRIVGYALHPIGWVLREGIFRPLNYLLSSTETSRSVFGYRERYDYRQPECFSADDTTPDCRSIPPFNYDTLSGMPQGESDSASLVAPTSSVYFPNVNFDFDSRKLNDLGKGKVKEIAEMLDKEPAVKVVLQGHTDHIGSDEYNMKLGMDRAEAVRSELVTQGVSADRLSTISFGESQPLHKEDTDWARSMNRRVELHPGEAAK
jgi:outer membrane protein OmpA-like peptidoglycan-associated protein